MADILSSKTNCLSSRNAVAPKLEVIMIIVFEKSTFRPRLSVKTPSSSTCNNTLKISG